MLTRHRSRRLPMDPFKTRGFASNSLVGDTNDTAGRAGTSVAGLLRLGMVGLAEVVGAGVDDDGALRV